MGEGLVLRRVSSHFGSVIIFEGEKYFQPRITFAAEGSARMTVLPPLGGSCLRVCSWQWSVLSWLIMTMSGSGSSVKDDMQDGSLCLDIENLGCQTFEVPVIHGSRSMVNVFAVVSEGEGKGRIGWKVSRNEASLLRCLTVKDIFELLYEAVEYVGEGHSTVEHRGQILERLILFFQVLATRLVGPK